MGDAVMRENGGPSQADSVSSTRLYLGNLPRDVTKEDIQDHFATHGAGKITEVKLMNGFGFIEYDDAMDARDVVPAFHGTDLKGQRLTVQFARGPRPREPFGAPERQHPRPRRTQYRMELTGLAEATSWQDLKDFARSAGLDVVYSEVNRERNGQGFVEFETSADLSNAVSKLDNTEFKGQVVHCVANELAEIPQYINRGRSRSPPRRGGYGPPRDDYYNRRPPPHAYDDRRNDYRRRTPPRDDYYGRPRYDSPPRGGPDYPPPPHGGYRDDRYGGPPPRRYDDPYAGGYDRGPPRRQSPPRGYGGGPPPPYDDRAPRGAY